MDIQKVNKGDYNIDMETVLSPLCSTAITFDHPESGPIGGVQSGYCLTTSFVAFVAPEPSTGILLVTGAAVLAAATRWRRRKVV